MRFIDVIIEIEAVAVLLGRLEHVNFYPGHLVVGFYVFVEVDRFQRFYDLARARKAVVGGANFAFLSFLNYCRGGAVNDAEAVGDY